MSQSFWCLICGRTTCFHIHEKNETDMNTVTKEKPEIQVMNPGLNATHDELVSFIACYLGDEVFARRFADCITTIRSKNADYTRGENKIDRIAAFRRIADDVGLSMQKVWAVFASKHWSAVMRFVKEDLVESEPVDGRINDIINYCVLLGAIIHDGEA